MQKFSINADDALLLVIDIQERLHKAMEAGLQAEYVKNSRILIETAKAFKMPIIVSEQYPRGLGATIPEIETALGGAPKIEKLYFSCWREEPIRGAIAQTGRTSVIVCGIETHVCVLQSVLDLLAAGYRTVLATDAVCSRRASDRQTAVAAMSAAGAVAYSTESIAFMLLEKAGTPVFKELSPLFK